MAGGDILTVLFERQDRYMMCVDSERRAFEIPLSLDLPLVEVSLRLAGEDAETQKKKEGKKKQRRKPDGLQSTGKRQGNTQRRRGGEEEPEKDVMVMAHV